MGYHYSYDADSFGNIAIFDLFLQILAVLGNVLVLMAVVNVKIGLVGFRRFLISLLANNIFLCVSQILIAIYLEFNSTIDSKQSCIGAFLDSLKLFAVFAALFNLCGMSLDHLIGIVNPLKYDYLMSTKFAKIAPFLIWIFAFIFGFADIPIAAIVYYVYIYQPVNGDVSYLALYEDLLKSTTASTMTISNKQHHSLVKRSTNKVPPIVFANVNQPTSPQHDYVDPLNDLQSLLGGIDANLLQDETADWCLISHSYKLYWDHLFRLICTLVAFVFLFICYCRIFCEIRKCNARMALRQQNSSNCNLPLPLQRKKSNALQRKNSRRLVMTTVSLFGVFAICWLPYIIFEMSVNPVLSLTSNTDDGQQDKATTNRLHILQHLFNSLFLSYPLIDSLICVTRVNSVRRYIHLMFLVPLKYCSSVSSNDITSHNNNHESSIIFGHHSSFVVIPALRSPSSNASSTRSRICSGSSFIAARKATTLVTATNTGNDDDGQPPTQEKLML